MDDSVFTEQDHLSRRARNELLDLRLSRLEANLLNPARQLRNILALASNSLEDLPVSRLVHNSNGSSLE